MFRSLLAIFVLCGSSAFAHQEKAFLIQGQIQSGKIDITISEEQASALACNLIVEKMEYFSDLQILDLRLVEVKNCPLDIYGQRKAQVAWSLPSYAQPKGPIRLRINGNVLGEINFTTNEISRIHEGVNP